MHISARSRSLMYYKRCGTMRRKDILHTCRGEFISLSSPLCYTVFSPGIRGSIDYQNRPHRHPLIDDLRYTAYVLHLLTRIYHERFVFGPPGVGRVLYELGLGVLISIVYGAGRHGSLQPLLQTSVMCIETRESALSLRSLRPYGYRGKSFGLK